MRLAFVFLLLLPANLGNGFEMNMAESDVTRFTWGYLYGDLVVGDSAYAQHSDFCVKNGKLYLIKNYPTHELSKYNPNVKVQVIPGNKVAVTIHPQGNEESFEKGDFKSPWRVTPYASCNYAAAYLTEELSLFEFESIEGFTDMLSYINHLKSLGFKYER